ncbi:MAG: mobile mystery protein A [Candidatus Tenebribacter davisii]|nr:mobile mystery protein A [Candidatus Tenebribacter davisii]
MKNNTWLIREQVQRQLEKYQILLDISVPPRGWIKAIKDALGMNGRQLAKRMGVTRQRISLLEKQECDGTVTLNTMKKSAEALDSVFVYCLVPRKKLEETVKDQARKVAIKRLNRASHTMNLENQELTKEENENILNRMIEDIIHQQPSDLWDYYA